MEKDKEQTHKVDYVKPEVLDLGVVTPALGGACNPTGSIYDPDCIGGGSPQDVCAFVGSSAYGCGAGSTPQT